RSEMRDCIVELMWKPTCMHVAGLGAAGSKPFSIQASLQPGELRSDVASPREDGNVVDRCEGERAEGVLFIFPPLLEREREHQLVLGGVYSVDDEVENRPSLVLDVEHDLLGRAHQEEGEVARKLRSRVLVKGFRSEEHTSE